MKPLPLLLAVFALNYPVVHAKDNQHYRVVVSFASVCCGTNDNDSAAIDRYIQHFQADHTLFLEVVTGSYGDEGDFNYCYQLNELNEQQQTTFITGLKHTLTEQIQASKRTSNSGVSWVTEYGACLGSE